MLDLRFVVENKDRILAMLASRGQSLEQVRALPGLEDADPWALDAERREALQKVEAAPPPPAAGGEEIARRGRAKEDAARPQGRDEGRLRRDQGPGGAARRPSRRSSARSCS